MNIDTELEIARLSEALRIAKLTIGELRSEISGDGRSESWTQRKVAAQAKALARLNERVYNQRFTLRHIEKLGRGLSPEELESARASEQATVASELVTA